MSNQNIMAELVEARQQNMKLMRLLENIKPIDLRDQFAMAALSGFTSATDSYGAWMSNPEWAARQAYQHADAMLKERTKEKPVDPI